MADHHEDPQRHLSAAVDAIAAERDKCRAEQAALQRFRRRIRNLSADATPNAAPAVGTTGAGRAVGVPATKVQTSSRGPDRLQRQIRAAYEETVMATDAAAELEQVPAEHMAAELGPDVSTAVFASSHPPPNLLATLDQTTTDAIDGRERVVLKIDQEDAALRSSTAELESIAETVDEYESAYPALSFRELVTAYRRLGELRADCAALAKRRQSTFHSKFVGECTRLEWAEYLYQDCAVTHPVLACCLETMEWIDEFRSTLGHDIATA
jgi:hypothetical protein